MIKQTLTNALIACVTVLLTLILLEAAVRVIGDTDIDGQFTFMGYALEPRALPISQMQAAVEEYLGDVDQAVAVVLYDEMLGWTYRPNAAWQKRTFTTNSAGLRAQREYSKEPPPDTLRIALFGDSFTAGDEAANDKIWGHQLEAKLNHGIRAEVLNFGVGGYGIDQAFLKWQRQGRQYSPDIVIFGFQSENLDRNLNIFRGLYRRTLSAPFTKPRFVLTDHGLELINSPAMPPEQTIAAYESFANHPLAAYEDHYQRAADQPWWVSSRLAGFMYEALRQDEDHGGPSSQRGMLGKAIVDAFAADVMARQAAFFVLHLPRQSELRRYHSSQTNPWQPLLDHFAAAYNTIPTEEYIDPSYVDDVYWTPGKHYGTAIHDIVAQTVAAEIQTCIKSASCALPRFEDRKVLIHH